MQNSRHRSLSLVQFPNGNSDPKRREGSKDERNDGDESRSTMTGLSSKDTEKGPGNGNSTSEITFFGRECVSSGSGFKSEKGEEDEYFRPYSCGVSAGVDAECFEGGYEDEDGDPAVSEGEGEVDEDLVGPRTSLVVPLDDPVDMGGRGINEQRDDERPNIMTRCPNMDVNGDKDSKDREPPSNTINDQRLSSIGELIKEIAE
jgi:hypothetical protein